MVLKHEGKKLKNNNVVVPTGFEPVFQNTQDEIKGSRKLWRDRLYEIRMN
jgi:hypothetical protein